MSELCAWLGAHGTSCAEFLGFVSGVLCVYLVTKENIWNWPLGVITSAAYIIVFGRAGLYSDTGLQAVYLILSLYGWWHWLRGGPTSDSPLPVSHVGKREMQLLTSAGLAMWMLFWSITRAIPGARAPLLDSLLVATSLVAQYMMTRKYIENWMLWILADVVYVGLYYSRGLKLSAMLYAVYLALAILGYIQWKRSIMRNSRVLS